MHDTRLDVLVAIGSPSGEAEAASAPPGHMTLARNAEGPARAEAGGTAEATAPHGIRRVGRGRATILHGGEPREMASATRCRFFLQPWF